MNFDLSGEQEQIRDSVRKFAASADRRALRSADGGYSLDRWRDMAELGLLALAVPENAGGMGGSAIDLAVVAEALGYEIAPDPWLENGVLPARLLAAAGRADLIESAVSGETFFAFAFAERARRFSLEPRGVAIEAVAGIDEVRGEKTFVSGGALAAQLLVLADRKGEPTIVTVPAASAGDRSPALSPGRWQHRVRAALQPGSAGRGLRARHRRSGIGRRGRAGPAAGGRRDARPGPAPVR